MIIIIIIYFFIIIILYYYQNSTMPSPIITLYYSIIENVHRYTRPKPADQGPTPSRALSFGIYFFIECKSAALGCNNDAATIKAR